MFLTTQVFYCFFHFFLLQTHVTILAQPHTPNFIWKICNFSPTNVPPAGPLKPCMTLWHKSALNKLVWRLNWCLNLLMEEAVENQRSMNVSAGNSQLDTNISFFFQTFPEHQTTPPSNLPKTTKRDHRFKVITAVHTVTTEVQLPNVNSKTITNQFVSYKKNKCLKQIHFFS